MEDEGVDNNNNDNNNIDDNLFGGRSEQADTYNTDIHARLVRRYIFKRELLILTVENFIVDNDDKRVVKFDVEVPTNETTKQCPTVNENDQGRRHLIRMLKLRRANREATSREKNEAATSTDQHEVVERMSNDELNSVLHVLDDLYKDVIDMIEFNENAGLAITGDNEDTVNLFFEILAVLLAR